MSASLAETIGSLRADLRRVEITLGTRIDARATANESWLRDEVRREREELFTELDRFREDVARCLESLRLDIRLLTERVAPPAAPASVEKAVHVENV